MEKTILSFSYGTIAKNGEVGNNDKGSGFTARDEFERAMAIADMPKLIPECVKEGVLMGLIA